MKVVLFCGGRGLRLREHSEAVPKPMVQIGYRPILWHVMRYYAHYGHRDFILCLGYRGDAIKDYFLHYDEAVSNDFVLTEGGRRVELLGSDIADWRITFADTGLDTTIGERLRRVRHLLEGEDMFLANYGDTLTDAPLDRAGRLVPGRHGDASFLAVRPANYPFSIVETNGDRRVTRLVRPLDSDFWINGGYFTLRKEVFDVIQPGEELVEAPFGAADRRRGPARDPLRGVLGAAGHAARARAPRVADRRRPRPVGVWDAPTRHRPTSEPAGSDAS